MIRRVGGGSHGRALGRLLWRWAVGRVGGPLLGGALYAAGPSWPLGLTALSSFAVAATLLIAVDRPRYVVTRAT